MGIFSAIFGSNKRKVECRYCDGDGYYERKGASEAMCAAWEGCSFCGGGGTCMNKEEAYRTRGRGYIYVDENGKEVK